MHRSGGPRRGGGALTRRPAGHSAALLLLAAYRIERSLDGRWFEPVGVQTRGLVWNQFMANPKIVAALDKIGFVPDPAPAPGGRR